MRKLISALLATLAAGALAAPAMAHDDDETRYGQYFGGYQSFDALYQHDFAGIRHGMSDGSYAPQEARQFLWELRQIRQRESYYRSRDGYLSPPEGRDIQMRLQRLHDVMHEAHEEGHAAQDDDWNGYGGYDPRR
jgi:hypothetical protein